MKSQNEAKNYNLQHFGLLRVARGDELRTWNLSRHSEIYAHSTRSSLFSFLLRHCERSAAIHCDFEMDCFAVLAMTNLKFSGLNQIEYIGPIKISALLNSHSSCARVKDSLRYYYILYTTTHCCICSWSSISFFRARTGNTGYCYCHYRYYCNPLYSSGP
jgi:hypothetical protein